MQRMNAFHVISFPPHQYTFRLKLRSVCDSVSGKFIFNPHMLDYCVGVWYRLIVLIRKYAFLQRKDRSDKKEGILETHVAVLKIVLPRFMYTELAVSGFSFRQPTNVKMFDLSRKFKRHEVDSDKPIEFNSRLKK